MKSRSVLFLKIGRNLPPLFFLLSEYLSELNIKLIPLKAKDVGFFLEKEKKILVSLVQDMKGLEKLNLCRERHLDVYLKNKMFFLLDLNSFGSLMLKKNYIKENVYYHLPLPLSIERVKKTITLILKNLHGKDKTWPGGRSPKLATQIFK
jgi:hypothetical protein